MKKTILLLALFGLFFGVKTYAQHCTAGTLLIEVGSATQAGGTVCIDNSLCSGTINCCYPITVHSGIQYICLYNGAGSGSGCPNISPNDLLSTATAGPCFTITIKNGAGTITDKYTVYHDINTAEWKFGLIEPGSNTATVAGNHVADISAQWDWDNGGLLFQLIGGGPAYDDEDVEMKM